MLLDQSRENIWYYFTHFDRGQYFPLNQLYYIGIYQLFEFDPAAFHTGSLLLHLINAGLVFGVIWKLFEILSKGVKIGLRMWSTILITVIFAIHPLQVEAVAWISASKVLLYSTFTLAGLLTYVYYKRSGKYLLLILTFLCYVLGLMSKEQAIIFPLNLLLIDFVLHTFHKVRFTRKVILEKLPFFLLALLFWYWSMENNLGVLDVTDAYPSGQRLVFGSYSLVIYLFRFLVPVQLLYFYGFPIVEGESIAPFYYIYVLMAILFVIYLIDLYRHRSFIPFFGLLFFLINILLVLHILPMPRTMITADRYMYVSVIGLAIWAVWGLYRVMQLRAFTNRRRYGLWAGVTLILIGYITYSNVLTRKWENSDTIKQEVREYLQPALINKPEE